MPRARTEATTGSRPAARLRDSEPRGNLPRELTSFVGRGKEISEVEEFLANTRLLTLCGPGGCGKTRLALAVASELGGGFEHGVWLVELASLSEPDLVPRTVGSSLGVRERPGSDPVETLSDHLGSKEMLLVLDNCEHLVASCATLAEALLRACQNLSILATSREPFGVAGEIAWPVPQLSLPDLPGSFSPAELSRYEATRLFIERATTAQPAFAPEPSDAATVARLCARLDGMPLAIELAAARTRVLSVEQIDARLDDRFALLKSSSRSSPPRQQTLRATMDWSHDLLPEDEKVLLRRLSVFAGGWTLAVAEEVCAGHGIGRDDVLELLSRLVDKSLVTVRTRGDEARYRLLETIRQYAWERLQVSGETGAVRQRHAGFFLELAEQAEPAMLGPEQRPWLGWLEAEHDNLRVALGWFAEVGEIERGLRLGGALLRFWWLRGHLVEGRAWVEEFLGLAGASTRTAPRAKALHALGFLIYRSADYAAGDQEVARSRLEEGAAIYRGLGDRTATAAVLRDLGRISADAGDWEIARSSLEESLRLEQETGNDHGIALTRLALGVMAVYRGKRESARDHLEGSLEVLRRLGGKNDIATALIFLGALACDRGDTAEARARYAEMLRDNPLQQVRWGAPFVLMAYARLAARDGPPKHAIRLAGMADTLMRATGTSLGPAYRDHLWGGL